MRSIAKQREAKDVKHKYGKTWKEGDVYHFVLEVGYTHYRFEVERWIDEDKRDFAQVESALIDTLKDVRQRYHPLPSPILALVTRRPLGRNQ